jgi:hypothetical protein
MDALNLQLDALRDMKLDVDINVDAIRDNVLANLPDVERITAQAMASADRALAQVKMNRPDIEAIKEQARASADAARASAKAATANLGDWGKFGYAFQRRSGNEDRAYERGQRALDGRRWDEALQEFTIAANAGGSRADGALYWKAYALARLGRRDDAVAAIAELRKSYASSRWFDDAKVLEAEVRQAGGQRLNPDSESDEDLKLMALNALVQSDPERAMPLLDNLLKSSSSPKLKERALFVVAQSNVPRGKQLLEQVARGGAGNPDLQLKAISYVTATSKRTDNRQLLWEIYGGSADEQVRRAVLRGFMNSNDKEHLLQIAKGDKSPQLRMDAINSLGASGAQAELWQIYQAETSVDVKSQILHSMIATGGSDRLVEVAKTEKEPKLRREAIQALGSIRSATATDALVAMYSSEQDQTVKKQILQNLQSQGNGKALVDLARKETDPTMKREIVRRLSDMRTKEGNDYFMEILK